MEYHYLIAGLPELSFDDGCKNYSVESLVTLLDESFSAKDRGLITLFASQFDNRNLLIALKKEEKPYCTGGNINPSLFEQIKKGMDDTLFTEWGLPPYMIAFLGEYLADETPIQLASEQLAALYYQYGMKQKNKLVSGWYELNLNINNILSAAAARKYGLDVASVVVGNNEVAQKLKHTSARDFGLTSTIDYADSILRIAEEPNLVDRERKTDLLKWQWLDEQSFFSYFTAEKALAFLYQLEMVERWSSLDKETGEQQFRRMINSLKVVRK